MYSLEIFGIGKVGLKRFLPLVDAWSGYRYFLFVNTPVRYVLKSVSSPQTSLSVRNATVSSSETTPVTSLEPTGGPVKMYPHYPRAHLLGIPQETRDDIYAEIVKRIQGERHVFEGNPVSKYDGMRLSCKQLHDETKSSVFCFGFTSKQLVRSLDFKLTQTNFQSVRSVSMEIPFALAPGMFRGIASFLDHIQLSLQELHLFFIGKDGQGNHTSIHGCGKKQQFLPSYHVSLLLDEGQDFREQWALLRQIAILRNLRVLQIENANLPLSAGLLYNNKPYLKALSVTSDPRSISSSLSRMKPAQVMQLYRNLGIRVTKFPLVRVLSLDANSAPDAEGIVAGVSQNLWHLSWRVPNPDFQPYSREKCFYSMTNRLIHILSWRAPQLNTLRLCFSMREREVLTEEGRQEFGSLTEEFSYRLHLFPALKHLEIHFRGNQGAGGFFKTHLVERLPPSLSRLYLSDGTISVAELVQQVRKRYFTYLEDYIEATRTVTPISNHDQGVPGDKGVSGNEVERVTSATRSINSDHLDEDDSPIGLLSCGEDKNRYDDIPLTGGNLGFVDFEYSCRETDDEQPPASDSYDSSDLTMLLRLNGQLLDREHHFHLANSQLPEATYGIKPPQSCDDWQPRSGSEETVRTSCHPGIYAAIRQCHKWSPKRHLVEMNRQDLLVCFSKEEFRGRWDWYFGNEEEAEEVFRREPVAKAQDQKQKTNVMEVEVTESKRCRWACPDLNVPPVGSFTAPKIPADWKDYV